MDSLQSQLSVLSSESKETLTQSMVHNANQFIPN